MKVKVPQEIRIGGDLFQLLLNKHIEDCGYFGTCKGKDLKILLSTQMKHQSIRRTTLLHELLHAINERYCQGSLDEKLIESISHGLNQVFSELNIEFDFRDIKERD